MSKNNNATSLFTSLPDQLDCLLSTPKIPQPIVSLHAVLNNSSRRILARRLNDTFETDTTAELLKEAAKGLPENTVPSAVMDSGFENVNGTVNELVSDGTIQRILAQVDIVESNSMIEA